MYELSFIHASPTDVPLKNAFCWCKEEDTEEVISSVAILGEGPGGPDLLLVLDQTEAPRAENNFFSPPSSLSQDLDDRGPALSESLLDLQLI